MVCMRMGSRFEIPLPWLIIFFDTLLTFSVSHRMTHHTSLAITSLAIMDAFPVQRRNDAAAVAAAVVTM